MAEYITSRVKLKTGTLSEWKSVWNSFIPLRGEQCVIIIPADSTDGESLGFTKSSEVRHVSKTGDGSSVIGNLPWDSDVTNIYESISTNAQEIGKLAAKIAESVKVFIGTHDEYVAANKSGSISVGTVVMITDDEDSSSTTSVLGEAILGMMLLGTT